MSGESLAFWRAAWWPWSYRAYLKQPETIRTVDDARRLAIANYAHREASALPPLASRSVWEFVQGLLFLGLGGWLGLIGVFIIARGTRKFESNASAVLLLFGMVATVVMLLCAAGMPDFRWHLWYLVALPGALNWLLYTKETFIDDARSLGDRIRAHAASVEPIEVAHECVIWVKNLLIARRETAFGPNSHFAKAADDIAERLRQLESLKREARAARADDEALADRLLAALDETDDALKRCSDSLAARRHALEQLFARMQARIPQVNRQLEIRTLEGRVARFTGDVHRLESDIGENLIIRTLKDLGLLAHVLDEASSAAQEATPQLPEAAMAPNELEQFVEGMVAQEKMFVEEMERLEDMLQAA